MITKKNGELCYVIEAEDKTVYITIQGGMMTCEYKIGNKIIDPYHTMPWWKEPVTPDVDNCIEVLRGDFFCMPFGLDDGEEPLMHHGTTAHNYWEPVEVKEGENTIRLGMNTGDGRVEKQVAVYDNEPVIYQNHLIFDHKGAVPLGYHPIIRFPDQINSGIISISKPLSGFTTPEAIEDPANGGYIRLKPGQQITDMHKVACLDGSDIDLTRYPPSAGYEDLALFNTNPELPFAFSAVAFPSEGYLYFQLKNPRVLRQTFFWMSNGGRHYAPWSGRIKGIMGLEEITSFFHYGTKASNEPNSFSKQGIVTSLDLESGSPVEVPLISGIVPIGADYPGVKDIVKKDDTAVTVEDMEGRKMEVACRTGFLDV
jgi:hypothetical protein